MTPRHLAFAAGVALGALALAIHTGCSVDSANGTARSVNINVGGVYRYDSSSCNNDGRFVTANSGQPVIYLDLRQSGDQLEAIDNNGIIFRGTIGNVVESTASFNLEGATTAGRAVVVSGNISVSGNKGLMQATWIEETFFATLCGSSTGQSVITNTPTPTNTNSTINIGMQNGTMLKEYSKLAWWTVNS